MAGGPSGDLLSSAAVSTTTMMGAGVSSTGMDEDGDDDGKDEKVEPVISQATIAAAVGTRQMEVEAAMAPDPKRSRHDIAAAAGAAIESPVAGAPGGIGASDGGPDSGADGEGEAMHGEMDREELLEEEDVDGGEIHAEKGSDEDLEGSFVDMPPDDEDDGDGSDMMSGDDDGDHVDDGDDDEQWRGL